ncbi:hypothetical protein Tsubulata_015200 [Turnera subulata]|uniref:Histone-lysine N-methyltransferase n=1 Tax=Turnera subulata TaxID=218843 RepID=A0A9Q0F984_9ROSI|nr:hypothetical protein Tsubulata_015200 [Turnera subulata]
MENSWQPKCGSTLQPSLPSAASSTLQEQRNQMEFSSSHYPHVGHLQRSAKMSDPTFPSIPNLSSYHSDHGDLANSFLALLSTPTSLLQHNFQDFSNAKPINASCKLAAEAYSTAVSATGSQATMNSRGLLSENYQDMGSRADLYRLVSSRALSSSIISSHSVLNSGVKPSDFCRQSSDPAKASVIHYSVTSNDKERDLPYLTDEWHGTTSANDLKLQNGESQMPLRMPSAADSHILDTASAFTSRCPRVFCSGASGDLLLSNTGLLGILCSCHCFHMSVSRFCEHSGLRNVNPGDAVRVENGETIAQWRKQYFQKFGIRIPEDQSGWDWPEGLSLTASLAKSEMPGSMSRNSECSHLAVPSGGLVRFRQPVDDPILLKNSPASQNSVVGALHYKKHGSSQDRDKIFDMVNTLPSNSIGVGFNQTPTFPLPSCPTRPMLVGRGQRNDYQTINAKRLLNFNCAPDHARSILESAGFNRDRNEKDVITVEKDSVSSIELRLGQPNQAGQTSRNPIPSPVGPFSYNATANSVKPFPQEQMIHHVSSGGGGKESRQFVPRTADMSNSSRSKDQLSYRNCSIRDASKQELSGNMAIASENSSLNFFNPPPESSSRPKVTRSMPYFSEHILPETFQCQPPAIRCNPTFVPWNSENGMGKQSTLSELGFTGPIEKEVVKCLAGNSHAETGLDSKMRTWTETPCSFNGVAAVDSSSGCSRMHDRHHFSHQMTDIPSNAPEAVNLSSYMEKIPSFCGNAHSENTHALLGPLGSQMFSGKLLSSKAVAIGGPSSAPSSVPGLNPTLPKQESIGLNHCFLDDNLRLLALRQILESSNPHLMSSIGKNLEQEGHSNFSNAQVQHSLIGPFASGEQRPGLKLLSKQHSSDVVMKPFQHGSTSLNSWYNFTTTTQGMPLCSKYIDLESKLPYDSPINEAPQLRLGSKADTPCSNDRGECCCQIMQYFQGNCNCSAYKKSSGSQYESRGENASSSFREPVGAVSCNSSLLYTSQFVNPRETSISLNQSEKLKGELPKNSNCSASQWRDVPKKVKQACEVACLKQSVSVVNGRGIELGHLGDGAAKGSKRAVQVEDSFKEQDISNVSSLCSAPAVVAQVSTKIDNPDSSPFVAGNTEYADNLVDEGSGIDKCWSSDDALESDRSAGFYDSTSDTSMSKDGNVKGMRNQLSRSLLDEVKLIDSLTWKRGRHQIPNEIFVHEKSNYTEDLNRAPKVRKRKGEMKSNNLDPSLETAGHSTCAYSKRDASAERPCLSNDLQTVISAQGTAGTSANNPIKPCSRRMKSTLPLDKPLSHKRDHCETVVHTRNGISEDSSGKKVRRCRTSEGWTLSQTRRPVCAVREEIVGQCSTSCKKESPGQQLNACFRKGKPVVCGKYGEISSAEIAQDVSKLVKIVSLESVIKRAKKCAVPKTLEHLPTLPKKSKRRKTCSSDPCSEKFSNLKKEKRKDDDLSIDEMNLCASAKGGVNSSSLEKQSAGDVSILKKKQNDWGGKDCDNLDTTAHAISKPKCKEIRKRSLYELTLKGTKCSFGMHSQEKIFKCAPKVNAEKGTRNSVDSQYCLLGSDKVKVERYIQDKQHSSLANSESFCCVCGSSNEDDINCLVECGKCLIKVHQACYGVYKVPKGTWYCRPCKTSSKNIVCVLCGYGGGAMTRAIRSHTVVKSLLKAWSFEVEYKPKTLYPAETLRDKSKGLHSPGSENEYNSFPVLGPVNTEPSTTAVCNVDVKNQLKNLQNSLDSASTLKVDNSITAGVFDLAIKQWVHMVCGLWTPGTRCPNVNTMSAFDVSGASCPRTYMICSICNRPGGTCIQCRVANCSVQFHPWCAHEKGLLQSEVEGLDNENIGFYGSCLIHATNRTKESAHDATSYETSLSRAKTESCARTEGYKGRKRDGFCHNLHSHSKGGDGGCLVPQEQLNAWVHINGQKSCIQGLSKLPSSDVEYDCRKEYARYKQSKGWKNLVVYKSGIHALGLYTSRFISRGEMVVEYVGEIVGLRVADKRENEYQSGRKLQYKSACYFFRIDKEHIIDATRKGGIARFVNHSCLPNCVAKVISMRNDKKVVFFAERDIYPGEEITYDYHFNHEDEGKKIPCFCNSKNCRRYLN